MRDHSNAFLFVRAFEQYLPIIGQFQHENARGVSLTMTQVPPVMRAAHATMQPIRRTLTSGSRMFTRTAHVYTIAQGTVANVARTSVTFVRVA